MRKEDFTDRATGRLIPIIEEGHALMAFVPDKIPRNLTISNAIMRLAEQASLQLGRLFGAGEIINPLLALFMRREAIASNAIEGTVTTARELYLFEAEESAIRERERGTERREVLNYVLAIERGIELLNSRPVSLNMINELHKILLDRVRGQDKSPGQIRRRQNAISRRGFPDARYIPPPASDVMPGIDDLEKFIHEDTFYPDLIRAALFHYQFEAIHPYLDGNGRLGRLLTPLLLCSWKKLPEGTPRLYLSKYFEQHDQIYRDRLLRISQNGEWDEWFEFFLQAILSESEKTWDKAHELMRLRDMYVERVKSGPGNLQEVVRKLFDHPVLKIKDIARISGVSRAQAGSYAKKLSDLEILKGNQKSWGQLFYADEILRVFFEETV